MSAPNKAASPLIYCKSHVAIHPSTKKDDNVFGFLICYRNVASSSTPSYGSGLGGENNHDFNVAWVRDDNISLSLKQQLLDADLYFADEYVKVNKHQGFGTTPTLTRKSLPNVDVRMLEYKSDWYCNINAVYSIQFRLPSQWYKGSIIINTKQHEYTSNIPVLFFHDDLCESTKLISKRLMLESFDPFTSERNLYWGGDDFKKFLNKNCDLQHANEVAGLNDNVYLVNPSLQDLRNFQTNKESSLGSSGLFDSSSKETKKPGLFESFEKSKWSVLGKIADVTNKLTNDDPKVNPILQTLYSSETINKLSNDKYVKRLLKKSQPQINKISSDFDGAKIYLAKWALNVKEQVEKQENVYKKLTNEMDNMVTEEEVHVALERNHPLSLVKWESMFDEQGRLKFTVSEIKDYIFHGGCVDDKVRAAVWPFLLNVYPWDSSEDERVQLYETLKTIYELNYKNQWVLDQTPDDFEEEVWKEEKFKIVKDVFRNDRHLDLYKHNTDDGNAVSVDPNSGNENAQIGEEDLDDDESTWVIKNPHLKALENILLSYNVYNPDLGYCQGMTDLLSPIYHVQQDEVVSFWSFIEFMNRMERNFALDQSGIKEQMVTLGELTSLMLPDLMAHLSKCDCSNLFFVYRMMLVLFKRDLDEEKVKQIWEIIFTNYYSSQFHLFFVLAIFQKNKVAIEHLEEFDDILKYFNDLKILDNIELMTRAELLFIKFKKIVMNVDETKTLSTNSSTEAGKNKLEISPRLRKLLSKEVILKNDT